MSVLLDCWCRLFWWLFALLDTVVVAVGVVVVAAAADCFEEAGSDEQEAGLESQTKQTTPW